MSRYRPYPAYKDSGVPWIGKVPEHWQIGPIKVFARIVNGATPDTKNDAYWNGDVPWFTPADLDTENATLLEQPRRKLTSDGLASCAAGLSPPGSVILSTRAPVGSVGVACCAAATNQGCRTLVPKAAVPSKLLAEILIAARAELKSWSNGTTFQELSTDALATIRVPMAPQDERAAIAAALDRETARIDALVAKKTRFIELLKEKRQALITHAVTKGLDSHATMRDSGVAWIGEVPAHWQTAQLGKVSVSRCDGPFGSGLKSEHYTDSGVRVIRLQNIGWAEFKGRDAAFIDRDYWQSRLHSGHEVIADDVLIAGLGDDNNPLGRACVAPDELGTAMVKADCYRFRLGPRAVPEYVALTLSATARHECSLLANGATRDRLTLTLAAARVIPLPPAPEQQGIVDAIGRRTSRIDCLVGKTERSIALLKERRAALITAAVTGQIDLRGEAA